MHGIEAHPRAREELGGEHLAAVQHPFAGRTVCAPRAGRSACGRPAQRAASAGCRRGAQRGVKCQLLIHTRGVGAMWQAQDLEASARRKVAYLVGIIAAVLVIGGGWYWYASREAPPAPPPASAVLPPAASGAPSA